MIGVLLVIGGTLLAEVSTSIGKFEINLKKESIYSLGFLSAFWGSLWFLGIVIYQGGLQFSLESLPTFLPRLLLEVTLALTVVRAVAQAERSTFGFIRILTVPFLFIIDLAVGEPMSATRIIGIAVIVLALVVAALFRGIHWKGSGLVLAAALMAVGTVTLYNYNITHFNSIESEQFIMVFVLMVFFFFSSLWRGEKPYKLLITHPQDIQAMFAGLATVVGSFAYIFAPPSVIMGAQRSSQVLWSVLSGRLYFKERHLFLKLTTFALLSAGLILLIV